MRLKNRTMQIPHGLRFAQPEVNWNSVGAVGKFPSWEVLVHAVIAMRVANAHHLEKHQWAVDVESVANEVDAYNTRICLDHGWVKYVMGAGGGSPPLPPPPPLSPDRAGQLSAVAAKAKKIWKGVRTLNNWLDSGEPAVAKELAEARAAVCVKCPKNGKGDFTKYFTIPAADSIRRQLGRLADRNLSTSHDADISICEVCLCPLKLKVQTPLKFIKPEMSDGMIDELRAANPNCWIISELAQ